MLFRSPNKMDYYLSFADIAQMDSAMSAFYHQDTQPVLDSDGHKTYDSAGDLITENVGDPYMVKQSRSHAIDIVGTIYKETGNTLTDSDGFEYPEMNPISGWHVNLRILGDERRADADALSDYEVFPTTPSRVWL